MHPLKIPLVTEQGLTRMGHGSTFRSMHQNIIQATTPASQSSSIFRFWMIKNDDFFNSFSDTNLRCFSCLSPDLASKKKLYSGITYHKNLLESFILVPTTNNFFNSQALDNCLQHCHFQSFLFVSKANFNKPLGCLRFKSLNAFQRFHSLA